MKIKWENAPRFLVWNKIKSLRKGQGITRVDLAQGTGLSITWIALAEQGANISDEAQKKIADFFEADVDDLFPAQMQGNKPKVWKTAVKKPKGGK